MNSNSDSSSEININEEKLYFFTAFSDGRYQTAFVGWLTSNLVEKFKTVDGVSKFAQVKVKMGEHTFITYVGAPLYLLNHANAEIYDFANDYDELDLYPSREVPADSEIERIIDFPTFFTREVEPLIEFKLFNKLWAQRNGSWVQLYN